MVLTSIFWQAGVFWTKAWEKRLELKWVSISNTMIESNTSLSKHWPTVLLWSLPEWIICQIYTGRVTRAFQVLFNLNLKFVNGCHFFYGLVVLFFMSFSFHKWLLFFFSVAIPMYNIRYPGIYGPSQNTLESERE